MIPRGILDIDWPTLLFAAYRTLKSSGKAEEVAQRIEQLWEPQNSVTVCLSVRSGLDAILRAIDWPAGSEILMSAVTIPQMAGVVQAHELVPVPLDVHPQSLAPNVDEVRSRITPRTRAVLVAHLFGSRLDLAAIARVARMNGLALWEDVAQGFSADQYRGHPEADASLFSFGVIKAQTALGGAIIRFRDQDLAARCRTIQAQWPEFPPRAFRRRVCKAAILRLVANQSIFSLLSAVATLAGSDLDERLSQSARAFRSRAFVDCLRRRPCRSLLDLLKRRLVQPDQGWIVQKTQLAERYRQLLPRHVLLGSDAEFPAHWVLPIRSSDPLELRARLWQQGFDATVRASQLRVIQPPVTRVEWGTPLASAWVPQLIYLPLHPALRMHHLERIAETVAAAEGRLPSPGLLASTAS